MRLRGYPDSTPSLSYLTQPQGSIVGSAKLPITRIVSVPGSPGKDGAPGEVTLVQLNTALATKVTRLAEGQNTQVYARNGAGVDTGVPYSGNATANTIPIRDANGRITVVDPSSSGHAATKNYVDTTTPKIADGAVISGPNNLSGAIGTWAPEAAGFVHLPHLFNDLAYNRLQGGSYTVTKNGVDTGVSQGTLDKMFEPNTTAVSIALTDKATDVFVIEVDCWTPFRYGTVVGIAMPSGFRGKHVIVEGFYNGVWNTLTTRTGVETGVVVQSISVPTAATAGMTRLRYTIRDFHSSASFRVSSVFALAYNSPLLEAGFVSRGGGTLFGALSYGYDPVGNNELTRKSYVDTKVAKQTGNTRVYVKDTGGNDSAVAYSSGATAQTMMYRTTGGVTSVGEPTEAAHAATKNYVDTKVAGIVNSAPATLDTLDELAQALGDDPNFATTVSTQIGLKRSLISTPNAIYATDASGNQIAGVWSVTPDANTVAVRDGSGRLPVASASAGTDAVNKNQLDAGLVNKVSGSNNGTPAALTLWKGTQAQYDAIATKDANTVYVVTA
ncbi:hypothetical protein SEA_NEDARYA_7 [Gordonia phage Nedarya]|nr:hypothetical protein SEA_NEDARYA_7 [Gordonia phage Nedarya]